jgi:allophanate hydrolase
MKIALTLPQLKAAYRRGVSPEEIVVQIYDRIAALDDPAIFITLRERDDVLAELRDLGEFDPARALWGVPFAVKDNIDVAGLATTAACPAWRYVPAQDAFVVDRLRKAGAFVIGKTNLDQFATGLVGLRSPYGAPRNALDPLIVPGGSSSGSAVAVAQGLVCFALGTDTAGSGRVPAALNNIVGLKPTLGTWSARGSVPACRSIETVSVFALTVEDARVVYGAGAAFDPEDAYSRRVGTAVLPAAASGLRIAVPEPASLRFFGDTEQAHSFAGALQLLRDAGHVIESIDFGPFYDVSEMLYNGAWLAERYGVIEDLIEQKPGEILPITLSIIGEARARTATKTFRNFYRLKELAREVEQRLESMDLLCVPSIPRFYSLADLQADPLTPNANLGTYTNFVNLLDMCGLTVPVPTRRDGRPASVTLLGRAGEDDLLAEVSACLECAGSRSLGATGWPVLPRQGMSGLPQGQVRLAVCGAHLSGLPLNGQLTSRGARLIGESRSAPLYRLFALAGDDVRRAGMIRTSTRQARGIALEIWAISEQQLGGLLAQIPAPLGLGRVMLESGDEVCGFVCEGVAAEGAEDITDTGGWRNWLALAGQSGRA